MGSAKKLVILLIEHDVDDIFMCRIAVERAKLNVEVHNVKTIDKAIHWLSGDAPYNDRNIFPIPHMVITDLRTPEETGLKLVRWMRAAPQYRELPIIVHSGSFAPGQAEECLREGATAAVAKEPLCQQLVDAITTMMDRMSLCEKN
jgi:CheY-like chemotaxis protein